MTFIAIDLGTSFIKGAVLDLDTLHLDHVERVPFPSPLPGLAPLYREFAPQQVLSATYELLTRLLPRADRCKGLVLCSQLHGNVFTDARGRPLSNLTTWQDQRVLMPHPSGRGSYFDAMRAQITPDQVQELGNEVLAGHPMGLFYWLAEQGLLPAGDVFPCSLPNFVLANLCHAEPRVDLTNAMAYGLLNVTTGTWHAAVQSQLGLSRLRLPAICSQGEIVGTLTMDSTRIPCFAPVGDYQAAIAGALLEPEELSLNISTGSQVSVLSETLHLGDYATRPFFDGRFLNTITRIPAGRALDLLIKMQSELAAGSVPEPAALWDYVIQQVAATPQTDLRVDLAFYAGSTGDHGGIWNLSEENMTIGHLFRAALENMASNYFAGALRLAPRETWRRLVFSGGLAYKIAPLREIIAAQFGSAARLCPSSEDTLFGLLALALACSGRAKSVRAAMADLSRRYSGDL